MPFSYQPYTQNLQSFQTITTNQTHTLIGTEGKYSPGKIRKEWVKKMMMMVIIALGKDETESVK